MRAGGTSLAVVVTAMALGATVAPALRHAVAPGQLDAAAVRTSTGVPVPSTAHRCSSQLAADPGGTRWCLPAGTSAVSLRKWYDDHLPARRSTDGMRWCIAQVQADGSTTALWLAAGALVGYQLPSTRLRPGAGGVRRDPAPVVETLRRPDHSCPRVARSMRSST